MALDASPGDPLASGAEPPPSAVAAGGDVGAARVQRLVALGRLTSGVVHDFNNLLQALRHSVELMRRGAGDADSVLRHGDGALRLVDRGARLTGQLLAALGPQRIAPQSLSLMPVLEDFCEIARRMLEPRVSVRLHRLGGNGKVRVDPAQLEAALINLAANAGEAMPQGGELTIACERQVISGDPELADGDYLCVHVCDTGTGMSEAAREHAFEAFFSTKPPGQAAGLGLTQVQALCRACGGIARIRASDARGTIISLMLPVWPEPAWPAATAEGQAVVDPSIVDPSSTLVVVVDDDAEVRNLLCDSLRLLGYRALPAADGLAGLAALDRHGADVLVINIAEPKLGGAEIARQARQVRDDVGIVLVAADREPRAAAAGTTVFLPEGAVLCKPFDLAALAAAVERASARA